jgi:predicted O-methyltransferase YrrM
MLGRAALAWLEDTVGPSSATLETGAGISTLVFAASGAEHDAVTPATNEFERIREEAARHGVDLAHVRFHAGPSHEVLLELPPRELDVALIDGAHGFPYPVIDWWFLAPRLRVGGHLLVDDAFLPPVAILLDYVRQDSAWRTEAVLGERTVVVRKIAQTLPSFAWEGERIGGGRVSYRHLPRVRRPDAAMRRGLFENRLAAGASALARDVARRRRGT